MITTYDTYDPSDTTDVNTVGAISENKFLGDTLDYLTFATRDAYILDKYSNCVNYGTDNYNATKQYTAYSDDFDSITGLHSLTYIDPTRMLDELTINGIAMTNQTTQLAGFNKLIDKLNCRLGFEGYQLTFNNNHHEILDDNSACQEVILDGIHTVREVLDYYLSTWDLSCRLKLNGSGVYEVYVVSPNKQGISLDLSNFNVRISSKGENYANAIVTNAKNFVPNQEVKDKELTLISDQIPFNTDSAYLETTANIYEVNNLYVNMDSSLVGCVAGGYDYYDNTVYSNNYGFVGYTCVLDIAGQTKDKEEFDSLETKERIACPYYTRGSRKIEHISTLDSDRANGYLQKVTVLQRAIDFTVADLLLTINANTLVDNSDEIKAWFKAMPTDWQNALRTAVGNDGTYINYERYPEIGFKIYSLSISTADDDLWKKVYFNVNYTARDDFSVRKGGSGLTIIDNQSNGTLDETRYLTSLAYKLDRLNNEEVEISTNANIFEVGDYYDTFVIDKCQIAHNGLNEQCHYHLQENYNAVGERTDVNRELRLYTIPTDRYVKAIFERQVLASNLNNADGIIINATVVKNGSEVTGKVYVPLIKIGKEATVRFKDNYAIRYFYTTDSVGWVNTVNVSEALRYCGADGEINSSMQITLVKYNPDAPNYPFNNNCTSVVSLTINFHKDAYEQIELVLRGGFNS